MILRYFIDDMWKAYPPAFRLDRGQRQPEDFSEASIRRYAMGIDVEEMTYGGGRLADWYLRFDKFFLWPPSGEKCKVWERIQYSAIISGIRAGGI